MSRGLKREQSLAEQTADRILSMIQIDGAFGPGDKIPNENDLAHQLSVSRTTLREAIRMLAAHQVLEIRRGRGTFVREDFHPGDQLGLSGLSDTLLNIRDLFEIRLIFEPQAAWYAAQRATEGELERILTYGRQAEEKIRRGEDRTQAERAFHSAIASATHNAFINELIPMIYRAIDQAVELSRMSIRRLWVRLSNCSRLSLYLWVARRMVTTSRSVGRGMGPDTRAPVRFAVSTIFSAAASIS